jgi:FAD/FMN-containing dehydrogenase
MTKQKESWGRYFRFSHEVVRPLWLTDGLARSSKSLLPYGCGRSYGDSCLNDKGVLVESSALDHFICFDPATGILRCEAGVTLENILHVMVPQGWFLPVTPGTQFVTIAGAVANDVHGKNHYSMGTIGCHVTQLELLRSSGERLVCSPAENKTMFAATIGGLGLTGFMTWVELKLIPVVNAFIQEESFQCANLDEMMALFTESDRTYQYTVSWIDCLAQGQQLGRGIFTRGNHCTNTELPGAHVPRKKSTVPLVFPPGCLNRLSVAAFNQLYYRKLMAKRASSRLDYDPFFYPLDAILHWNRLYGPQGFIQYQCVLVEDTVSAMKELLAIIARSGQPSPLNVLKTFGEVKSPGMLSFPRKGLTLALDFPNRGEKTLRLCRELDKVVKQAKGALYPAKDSRMPPEMFALGFPRVADFRRYKDPQFSSSFWRRVQPD